MKKVVIFLLICASFSWAVGMKSSSVVLSKSGIKGLNSNTKFKKLSIKRLFPKLNIQNSTRSSEGESYKVINVKRKNRTLFIIEANSKDRFKIGRVTVVSKDIDNQFEFNIGDKYTTVFGKSRPKCIAGEEESFGSVICTDSSIKNFKFIFDGKSNKPDGKLPSKNTLRKFKLSKIIWEVK